MKILVLAPAPNNISPSQRFRFEHYIQLKNSSDISFVEKPFFDAATWALLHKNDHLFQKAFGIAKGFARRWAMLFSLHKYSFVFIHREAAPIGPPVFEWLMAKVFKKKIIYDFDDAIWVSTASEANPRVATIKCTWKVENICRMSHIVSVGNNFLAEYARQYCSDVRIIPTVVNTSTRHNIIKDQNDMPLVIGWTGTFTNFYNLKRVTSVLHDLQQKYAFEFLIIANKDPKFDEVNYTYQQWKVDTEIPDLLQMNIGIMPLDNTEIEKGKCAFKAIQYMSLGIPAVVSPVGANMDVVQNGTDGFWADSAEQWYNDLEKLILDRSLRQEMGALARQRIVTYYSVDATTPLFFGLFDKAAAQKL